MAADDPKPEAAAHEKLVTIIVHSPRTPTPKPFRWPLDKLIGDAAKEAAKAFGYEVGGNPTLQREDGTDLDRGATIRSSGLKNGDKVEIVDAGGGV